MVGSSNDRPALLTPWFQQWNLVMQRFLKISFIWFNYKCKILEKEVIIWIDVENICESNIMIN